MKIISRVFLDGRFFKMDELLSSDNLHRIPDQDRIKENLNSLRNNKEDVWGYFILIHENGITNSPIKEDDLIVSISKIDI
jgi:hypothetical protein